MPRRAGALALALALAALALLAVGDSLRGPVTWTPDGLFYQARALELAGTDRATSLEQTFGGAIGAELRRIDPEHSGDPAWSAYHARFYERRVMLPAAANIVDDVAGERALLDLSLAGYVAAILAIFALLLLRFRPAIAGLITMMTILMPALAFHARYPQTDSWGLALLTIALGCGLLALDRGPRWLVPWTLTILLLSFTRDNAWIAVLASLFLAIKLKSKVTVLLAATGLAAVSPALLLFRTPARELLATMLNGTIPNPGGSWSFIVERYPGAVIDMLHADGGLVLDGAWYSALYLLTGLALLFALTRGEHSTTAMTFVKAAAVAGAAFVLAIPVFSAFRLEIVLIPMAAVGFALAAERIAARLRVSLRVPRSLALRSRIGRDPDRHGEYDAPAT